MDKNNQLGVPSFPAMSSQQRLTVGQPQMAARNKVALKQGRSLMDWIRLCNGGRDLSGVGPKKLVVTPDELAKHNSEKDCWMSINGKVYNVTDYMEYHPGGMEELMRGAGQDATHLFNQVHRWVNFESMLAKCFVGKLKTVALSSSSSVNKQTNPAFAVPVNPVRQSSSSGKPRYDWFQTEDTVTVTVFTKCRGSRLTVTVDKCDANLLVNVFIKDFLYTVSLDLEDDVLEEYLVKKYDGGKIDIQLQKAKPSKWKTLGTPLDGNDSFVKRASRGVHFRECTITSIQQVTHDTNVYELQLPTGSQLCLPVGHHVHVKAEVQGVEISRSYTCITLPGQCKDIDSKLHLMIKVYPNGTLTPHIGAMKVGDTLQVSDPDGTFDVSVLNNAKQLVMLAGGTGFTPMIRLLWDGCHTNIKKKLIFFNKTKDDILWKDKIDQLIGDNQRLSVVHVLSKPDSKWGGTVGHVDEELLRSHVPERDVNNLCYICVCGPTPFTEEVNRLLKKIGYSDCDIHLFLGQSSFSQVESNV